MGAFFDTVYIRGIDRPLAVDALGELAGKLNCCFLLAPEIRGWTAIYSSREQDGNIANAIQKRLSCEVLYTLLHDSDLFCYDYYRDGDLVDEYNSRPDYFGKVSAGKRERLKGSPRELRGLLQDPADEFELRRLLMSKDDPDMFHAHKLLDGFARLLGLPNSNASYGYLMAKHDDTEIEQRADFIHIPDLAPEKAKRAQQSAVVNLELQRLQERGILLYSRSPAPVAPCPEAAGNGFLTLEMDPGFVKPERPVYRIAGPSFEPEPVEVNLQAAHRGVTLSPSGRLLAAASGRGVDVWDWENRRRLLNLECKLPAHVAGFTPDEAMLVTAGQAIELFSIPDGQLIRTIPVRVYGNVCAVHPSSTILVGRSEGISINVVDLLAGEVLKMFTLNDPSSLGAVQRMQLAAIYGAVSQGRRKLDVQLSHWESELGESAPRPEEEDVEACLTEEEPRALLFTPDARFLICGSNKGVWVYDWQSLVASSDKNPKPLYRSQLAGQGSGQPFGFLFNLDFSSGVTDLAFDPDRNCALVACGNGQVRELELATGFERTLLTVPSGSSIQNLRLSADRTILCTIDRSMDNLQKAMQRMMGGDAVAAAVQDESVPRLLIWDYRKLRERPAPASRVIS
jgi:WD40 repeat protein